MNSQESKAYQFSTGSSIELSTKGVTGNDRFTIRGNYNYNKTGTGISNDMMPLIGTTVAIQATNVLPNTGKTITRMPITTCWANIHWNWPTRTWCGGLRQDI